MALTALVERHYSGCIAKLSPFVEYTDGGGVYRINRHDGPPWVLRLFPSSRPLARVRGDAAILAYLGEHAAPAEQLIPTIDGAGAAELDGQAAFVTLLVAGKRPDRSRATLKRLGEAIGKLNALPPVPSNDPSLSRRAGSLPREDLKYGSAQLDQISGIVPRNGRGAFSALRDVLEATNDCESLPMGLVHSDCHLDNALVQPNGQPVLIDWVGAGVGPKVVPLGLLLYSCTISAPGDAPGVRIASERQAAVEAIIEGYCKHHVLSPVEMLTLGDAVRVRPVVVAAREYVSGLLRGDAVQSIGWWSWYEAADEVAAYACQAMRRIIDPTMETPLDSTTLD